MYKYNLEKNLVHFIKNHLKWFSMENDSSNVLQTVIKLVHCGQCFKLRKSVMVAVVSGQKMLTSAWKAVYCSVLERKFG